MKNSPIPAKSNTTSSQDVAHDICEGIHAFLMVGLKADRAGLFSGVNIGLIRAESEKNRQRIDVEGFFFFDRLGKGLFLVIDILIH